MFGVCLKHPSRHEVKSTMRCYARHASLFVRDVGVCPVLGFAEAGEEDGGVGNGLFDELLEQEQFGTVDDGMNALLKGLQRRKRLKRVTEKNDCCVAALAH